MNGNGIVPTVDLGNNSNNGGWGGNMGEWILGIIALGMLGNGGMFGGNGQTNLMDLLGFAIVASIFPNFFGGGYGFGGGGNGAAGMDSIIQKLLLLIDKWQI